jgi:hypothetical protein
MDNQIQSERTTAICLWLLPVIFLLHSAEEYWGGGGYSAYMGRTRGVAISPTRFIVLSSIGWSLILLGVVLARKLSFPQWLLACLGSLLLVNGLSHTARALSTTEYNPGLASALVVFIPFGAWTLVRLKPRMMNRSFWTAALVGLVIQVSVTLISLSGGRQPAG